MNVLCAVARQIQRSIWICLELFDPLFLSREIVETRVCNLCQTAGVRCIINQFFKKFSFSVTWVNDL